MIVYRYDSRSQDYMDTIEVSLKSIDSIVYIKHLIKLNGLLNLIYSLTILIIVVPEGSLQRDNVSLICVDSKQVKLY